MANDSTIDKIPTSTGKPKIKKSKYSRGGCSECKRRKIKCDEAKPSCYKCSKLNKICSYPNNSTKFKFENPIIQIESNRVDNICGVGESTEFRNYTKNNIRNSPGIGASSSPRHNTHPHTHSSPMIQQISPSPISHLQQSRFPSQLPSIKRFKISDMLSPSNDPWVGLPISDLQNLFDDASLLVQDSLGLFLTTTPYQTADQSDDSLNNLEFNYRNFEQRTSTTSSPLGFKPRILINKNLIESVLNEDERSEGKLDEIYLNELINTRLGFHFFPFADSMESNQVLIILLKYLENCNYLLLSLLAASATFQFIQTTKKRHYEFQSKYTNLCLKHLCNSFSQHDSQKENFQTSSFIKDIEKLLLTILVLTMNFSALAYYNRHNNPKKDSNINWKTHLRGVNELLLKYTKLCPSTNESLSDGVALAKTWFFSIESVAELHDPCGGTIKYNKKNISQQVDIIKVDDELETSDSSRLWIETGYFSRGRNLSYHDSLLNLGIITNPNLPISSQFSLFLGFSLNTVALMDKMTRCLDLIRSNPTNCQISCNLITTIFSYMNKGRINDIVPKANKETFIIPIESVGHPEYSQDDKIELPKSCYCHEITSSGEKMYYSWFDWSEQLHIDSINLKLFRIKGLLKLPKIHPLVQELKNKIIDSMFFIKELNSTIDSEKIFIKLKNFYLHKDLFDERAMMIQSCFRDCSKIVTDLLEFEKLELYFKGLSELGNGSSLFGLEMVKSSKEKFIAKGMKYNDDEDEEEEGEDSNNDAAIIPYC